MDAKTGFVLVHGGHGCAANWEDVVPLLDGPSIAVDLPGRGGRSADGSPVTFRVCAQAVLDAADDAGFDRLIAVGHSMGGLTISALADLAPDRVAHLVYVAALVPAAGTTVFDLYYSGTGTTPPTSPDGIVHLGPIESVHQRLFDDVDEELLRRVYGRMVDEPQSLFVDPAVEPPSSIPRTYIRCAHDVPVPPSMASAFVERLGASTTVVDLDLGHGLIYTDPPAVAKVLNEVRRGVPR